MLFQTFPGLSPGADGSIVCVVMRDSAGSYRTEKAGGLATTAILPREARILKDGAACICLKAMIGPSCKKHEFQGCELDGAVALLTTFPLGLTLAGTGYRGRRVATDHRMRRGTARS